MQTDKGYRISVRNIHQYKNTGSSEIGLLPREGFVSNDIVQIGVLNPFLRVYLSEFSRLLTCCMPKNMLQTCCMPKIRTLGARSF
jgi:hypothetical protein